MPKKNTGVSAEKKKLNPFQDHEVKHIAEKTGASSQAIGALNVPWAQTTERLRGSYQKTSKNQKFLRGIFIDAVLMNY